MSRYRVSTTYGNVTYSEDNMTLAGALLRAGFRFVLDGATSVTITRRFPDQP